MSKESLHDILLYKEEVNEEYLPIIHSTKIKNIPLIFGSGILKTAFDDTLNKDAVFFFYGRSAYRFKNGEAIVDLLHCDELPIVFIFSTDAFEPDMIHPFDTGGFSREKFTQEYGNLPNRSIEQYELSGYSDVKKFIRQIYDNNEGYRDEKAHSFECLNSVDKKMIDDVVCSINNSKTKQTKTIEIKSFSNVDVSKCKAIVVPTQIYKNLDEKEYKTFKEFCDNRGIEILQYFTYGTYKLSELNAITESKVYEYEYKTTNGDNLCT